MRVVFISTPSRTSIPNGVLPLGVIHLAAYAEKNGHVVKVIDVARTRQSHQQTVKDVGEFSPDLIAVSGIITAYSFIKALVGHLKQAFPQIPVVIGGHVALDNAALLLKSVRCDYVITGYGEISLEALLRHFQENTDVSLVPGLSYLAGDQVVFNNNLTFVRHLDELPFPAYHHVDMEYYATITKVIPKLEAYLVRTGKTRPLLRSMMVMGALGCTDRCSFCVHEFHYKGLHRHSFEYVIENIRLLYKQYGIRIFLIGEEMFLYNASQAREFSALMNKNFPDAYYSFAIRADYVSEELVSALEGSNCYSMAFGFESGSDEILNVLNKRMRREINIRAYKILSCSRLSPACSFMVGSPGENLTTVMGTVKAIEEAKIVDSAVFFTTPYPGSRIFRWAQEHGLIGDLEQYLEFISNRDAALFSVNLTGHPDWVVHYMHSLVKFQLKINKPALNFRSRMIYGISYLLKVGILLVLWFYFLILGLKGFWKGESGKIAGEVLLNKRKTLHLNGEEPFDSL